jgi:predicted ester cyclase
MNARFILVGLSLSLAGSILSCVGESDNPEKNKTLVLQTFDALNNREYDKLDQFIAHNYRRHCQATPEAKVESLEEFRILLQQWDQAVPDAEAKLDMIISEGDLVAFYGTYSGTQEGPMGPFPATGKRMVSEMSGFHRLEGGRIVETWVTWDNLAILNQLGLFPSSEADTTES